MATKKQTIEVPEGFTDTTKAEPIPDPTPEKPAFEPYHQLSEDEARRVAITKQAFDAQIVYLKTLRDSYHDAEVQRIGNVGPIEGCVAGTKKLHLRKHHGKVGSGLVAVRE